MALDTTDIRHLYTTRGRSQYGREAINQLEHALQCAYLAEQAGETPQTIVACLLHDLGHLLAAQREGLADHGQDQDDLHQYIALPFLRELLPDAVLEPIRLHVDAKRYLCTAEPAYRDTLSPASVHSLALQGGAYTAQEAQAFMQQPFAAEAVRLRRYDDLAKVPQKITPALDHYLGILGAVCHARH